MLVMLVHQGDASLGELRDYRFREEASTDAARAAGQGAEQLVDRGGRGAETHGERRDLDAVSSRRRERVCQTLLGGGDGVRPRLGPAMGWCGVVDDPSADRRERRGAPEHEALASACDDGGVEDEARLLALPWGERASCRHDARPDLGGAEVEAYTGA